MIESLILFNSLLCLEKKTPNFYETFHDGNMTRRLMDAKTNAISGCKRKKKPGQVKKIHDPESQPERYLDQKPSTEEA